MRSNSKLDPADLFPPSNGALARILAQRGAKELLRTRALTRNHYSTERFLLGPNAGVHEDRSSFQVKEGLAVTCEASNTEVSRYCSAQDLTLASDASTYAAMPTISAAFEDFIAPYPFLLSSVLELTWRIHIVVAQDEDYDVSFSDPAIPFSVFISSPSKPERNSVLRVAENLVHETMHLQLTLFEASRPLIKPNSSWTMYSPWMQQARPAQGILHGLYVFSILRWMWQQVSEANYVSPDRVFAFQRIAEIDEEVEAVQALHESPALTEAGHTFLSSLLKFAKQPAMSRQNLS